MARETDDSGSLHAAGGTPKPLIVVGVDGSAHGREALAWAISEAAVRNARVVAVHAWTVPVLLRSAQLSRNVAHLGDQLRQAAGRTLTSELEQAGVGDDIDVETQVVEQQPAEALLRTAAAADLLVVGSRGHGAIAGSLLGSISQQCLHHAPCPIAVVHSSHHGDRRRVVVGFDGSGGAKAALAWATDEARLRGTSVRAVCAYNEPAAVAGGGAAGAGALAELRFGLERSAEQMLEEAEQSVTDAPVSTQAVHGPAADGLLTAASDAQLLVVGSRGRGGFASLVLGSVSQQCAARAKGVVVVVRAPQ